MASSRHQRLYVRRLDDEPTCRARAARQQRRPFFSPDGRWLAFAVGTSITGIHPPELRKYSLDTKLTQTIATVRGLFRRVLDASKGAIVFVGAQPRGHVHGALRRRLTNAARRSGSHRREGPDARRWRGRSRCLAAGAAGHRSGARLQSGRWRVARPRHATSSRAWDWRAAGARFVAGGYIVYGKPQCVTDGSAVRAATRRTTGTPVALMPDIAYSRNNVPGVCVVGGPARSCMQRLPAMEPARAIPNDTCDPGCGTTDSYCQFEPLTLPARVCTVA